MVSRIPVLRLFDELVDTPELTAKEIATRVKWDRVEVNRILYANPRVFIEDGARVPRWSARSIARSRVTKLAGER